MKGRVEDGHVWKLGKRLARPLDAGDRGRVVKRRQWLESDDFVQHVHVDETGIDEPRPAVDDTMRHGRDRARIDVVERSDPCSAFLLVDDRELQARRAMLTTRIEPTPSVGPVQS